MYWETKMSKEKNVRWRSRNFEDVSDCGTVTDTLSLSRYCKWIDWCARSSPHGWIHEEPTAPNCTHCPEDWHHHFTCKKLSISFSTAIESEDWHHHFTYEKPSISFSTAIQSEDKGLIPSTFLITDSSHRITCTNLRSITVLNPWLFTSDPPDQLVLCNRFK